MGIKNLNSGIFDEAVKDGISVVDFYADWCMPCKALGPMIERMSEKFKDVKFGKINVDKEIDLAQRFMVMGIPTVIFFKKNEQIDRFTGLVSEEVFLKKIESLSRKK